MKKPTDNKDSYPTFFFKRRSYVDRTQNTLNPWEEKLIQTYNKKLNNEETEEKALDLNEILKEIENKDPNDKT